MTTDPQLTAWLDQEDAHTARMIREHRFAVIYVWGEGPDEPAFGYTIGLFGLGHPELVLVGHDHTYQRYTALDARGTPTPGGLVEVIVGTGGQEHAATPIPRPSLLVSDNTTYGVLKLVLRPDGYVGQFLPAAGTGSFTDSFSGSCA